MLSEQALSVLEAARKAMQLDDQCKVMLAQAGANPFRAHLTETLQPLTERTADYVQAMRAVG